MKVVLALAATLAGGSSFGFSVIEVAEGLYAVQYQRATIGAVELYASALAMVVAWLILLSGPRRRREGADRVERPEEEACTKDKRHG